MLILILLITGCARAATPATRPQPTTEAQPTTRPVPVAAVWTEMGMPLPGERKEFWQLTVGAWSDGTIVWSAADDRSGKPYLTAKVPPERIEKLVHDLDEIGFFSDAEVNHHRNRYPPDAAHTVIAAEAGERRQKLALWRDPPKDRFGEVWKTAKVLVEALRQEDGKPLDDVDRAVFGLGRGVR